MFQMHFDDPAEPPVILPPGLAISIGRGDSCDVRLHDSTASRVHCRIVARDGRVSLYDAGSRWGTFVNDHRVSEVDLTPGDRIRIGDTVLRLECLPDETQETLSRRTEPDHSGSKQGGATDQQLHPQRKLSSGHNDTSNRHQSGAWKTSDNNLRAKTSTRSLRNGTSDAGMCEPPPLPFSGIHQNVSSVDTASVPTPLNVVSRDAKNGMWHVSRNGKSHGPFTSDELRRKSVSGELVPTDLIRKENGKKWQMAGRTRGLFSPETVKQTPPPLPSEVQVVQPGILLYLLSHWRETRGNKWAPILLGVLPACVLSFLKPLLTWQNQALIAALIFMCSVCLFSMYLLIQCYKYTRGQRSVTSESYSRLSCWSHHLMSFVVLLLLPLLFVEYFINNRGLVATSIPVVQELQDELFGDNQLPSLIAPLLEWQRKVSPVDAPAGVDKVGADDIKKLMLEGDEIESILRRQLGSTFAADEEFEVAASHIGERERVVAGQLIKFRNRDKWSWERLNREVEFQFHSIRQPFRQWREDRISAGDRFK